MNSRDFIIFCGGRNCRPVDKFDVMIARIALFALKFTLGLIIAFFVLLFAVL